MKEAVEKKTFKTYGMRQSEVSFRLFQMITMHFEQEGDAMPVLVDMDEGDHEDQNVVLEQIREEMLMDLVQGRIE